VKEKAQSNRMGEGWYALRELTTLTSEVEWKSKSIFEQLHRCDKYTTEIPEGKGTEFSQV